MRTSPECYDCLLRQAVSVITSTDLDQKTQINIIKEVLRTLEKADDTRTPSLIASQTNRVIKEKTGIDDLYIDLKLESHLIAQEYLEDLRDLSKKGDDFLEQGLKISAAGNIFDIFASSEYDLWEEVKRTVNQELLGGGVETFREQIGKAPYLLYLADNVGETIFDRVFIETLDIPVIYAVKSGPILNDATLDDALAAGIDQVAEIIETGSHAPGTILEQCSDEFKQLFEDANLVLAKGAANYETLDDRGDKLFFLFRVKCPIISRDIKTPQGNQVLKQGVISMTDDSLNFQQESI
ncbi:MAG: ARMT1-like domain-containing protein [Anaerolineales bacterium]|nr:ARMT1-like domain-containing protein [Anaerolineales bacterium]